MTTELGRVRVGIAARHYEASFPSHKAGMTLEHNPHLSCYQSVEDYIWCANGDDFWVSDESYQAAIESNSFWALTWYPHTPVGHCVVYGHTLEEVLKQAKAATN